MAVKDHLHSSSDVPQVASGTITLKASQVQILFLPMVSLLIVCLLVHNHIKEFKHICVWGRVSLPRYPSPSIPTIFFSLWPSHQTWLDLVPDPIQTS